MRARALQSALGALFVTDIFREVDEEIRQDNLKALWDRYGIYVLGACIGIVLAVAGLKGWEYYQRSTAEAAGARYIEAIDLAEGGKTAEAEAIFAEMAEGAPAGYATLARFQRAASLVARGDKDGAVTEYVRLANDGSLSDLLRGLANVRAAVILIDIGSRDDVDARLSRLNTRDNPWRNTARELLGLAAYKSGDVGAADRLYNEIVGDPAAATNVKQRAQVMLSLLAPERRPARPDGKPASGQTTQ
jgi:hypothetical protein